MDVHERRLALAFDVDTSARIISPSPPSSPPFSSGNSVEFGPDLSNLPKSVWKDGQWSNKGSVFVLDAPSLRDDFYCSILAYSDKAKVLAVGLANTVYFWNEAGGVESPASLNPSSSAYVASLSFSSKQGGKAILAVGRSNGQVVLYSPLEAEPRFDSAQSSPICSVSFRPNAVKRPSNRDHHIIVDTEELLVGDEIGNVLFYVVEWPTSDERDLFNWPGCFSLLVRITVHTQQICGIAWSPDGESFATGGNDNQCYLFETRRILSETHHARQPHHNHFYQLEGPTPSHHVKLSDPQFNLSTLFVKHSFSVAAAVKAIAFCPWQRGLIAIGGGSNDRQLHFFHTLSGAALATINCHAQVTSLIWSTTRREIAATFGFAQPEHPFRIAIFRWPSCEVVIKIPWLDEHRALFAIPYPGGPNEDGDKRRARSKSRGKGKLRRASSSAQRQQRGREGNTWWSRTEEEGCLVVATSDCSIKFHEVWAEDRRTTSERSGILGSDILDLVHGIEAEEGKVIR